MNDDKKRAERLRIERLLQEFESHTMTATHSVTTRKMSDAWIAVGGIENKSDDQETNIFSLLIKAILEEEEEKVVTLYLMLKNSYDYKLRPRTLMVRLRSLAELNLTDASQEGIDKAA